ncbi:T9SS type A sorting domain-containing protein [Flavobacterium amnicola]|uniref:T9SS type A sorting domain-containing protein n=1 Tax=Flavobacterium amnicola TaxID=2506422 RepID=A0A4V1N271_9FLAO|nr:zinc-dependent metalloprotease family protein [Flavobacterium amnicola]RXR20701.1 T9SS type A sorting domain-containing protein [Flavobacterium amnicola]
MKKQLLTLLACFVLVQVSAQTGNYWTARKSNTGKIVTAKGVERPSFPKTFDLYDLNINPLRQVLFSTQALVSKQGVVINLPNANGQMEQFEVYEASNFEPALQAQFPEIRAYSGKGITDPSATLKLSIAPNGIQTMVFRTDRENEFMEAYSQDGKTYAVYKSQRNKGSLPFTCTTEDNQLMKNVNSQIEGKVALSSDRKLRTMRLAQSVTAEYSAYYGWTTTIGNIGLVVTAVNNTMTRCNGVYEKDLGLHLNLIPTTTSVFFNNPATDGYTDGADTNYNSQLQTNLTNIIGDANYDIGHLFSAVGGITGNGNAGCIGCVCDTGKGSGFTTRSVPQGDDFDIDFVVHEVGHQLGANHTFTMGAERSGNNMEPGSGVTIMGYAGITSQDIDNHSIDTFHATSISQMQSNLSGKTCPVVTDVPNMAPTVAAGVDYVIPISTPFVLEGTATDPNGTLSYQWEQFDHDTANQTGANSDAATNKTIGPNWQSWPPTSSGNRYMPRVESIIANAATTSATVNGSNDAGILTEALSSVSRTLTFRLTVRDNVPYVASTNVGQTNFDDKVVTVSNTSGPFVVNIPSATGLSYTVGTNQTVTWNVASTNAGAVNCPFVDIYLFTDNTLTNGILLAHRVPNDGSETVTIPNNAGTTHRVMVRGNNNIFFDISNNNFTIAAPASSFAVSFNRTAGEQNKSVCQGPNTINYTIDYTALAGFSGTTNFTATGVPANTTVVFTPTSLSANGTVNMAVTTTASTPVGLANIIVNATSGATTKTVPFYLDVNAAPAVPVLTTPANNATAQNTTLNLTWGATAGATNYDVEVSTNGTFTAIVATGNTTTTSFSVSGLTQGTDYWWRVLPKNSGCQGVFTSGFKFTTFVLNCTNYNNNTPVAISASGAPTINSIINVPSGGTLSDVNLTMNITHTYVSDLTITLLGPTGASAIVFNQSCGSSQNINTTFDDSGSVLACGGNPAVSGIVIPANALSVFNGTNPVGNWTLRVADGFNLDGGTLNSWSLNLCSTAAPLSTQDFEFADFSISPNPSNGNFNVKFSSVSSNGITINVHDMRGRQVYEKSYTSNGAFNQDISLNNVEAGIYLVSIVEGNKKIVRKIIVE